MTTQDDDGMKALEDLLAEAARDAPAPPPGLMARVLADADRVQAELNAPAAAARAPRLLVHLRTLLPGGWQGAGGLIAATCAGFWIGVSPPEILPDPGGALFGSETVAAWAGPVDPAGFGWAVEEE